MPPFLPALATGFALASTLVPLESLRDPAAQAAPAPVVRVNVGGPAWTDTAGRTWAADTGRGDGRRTSMTGKPVAGTADDRLYQHMRVKLTRYEVPVPEAGTYRVTLHLQENYHSADGRRVFSATGEGRPVVTDLDLHRTVGKRHAHQVSADVPVTDGVLDLAFTARKDGATLSAVEARLVGTASPAPAPSPSPAPPAPVPDPGPVPEPAPAPEPGPAPVPDPGPDPEEPGRPADAELPLRASADGRSVVNAEGRPFLYLADTAWLAPSRLDQAEVLELLDTRAEQGFTAVQMSVLPFLHRDAPRNAYGDEPFVGGTDLSRPLEVGARTDDAGSPDYDYWDHVAWVVEQAEDRGLVLTLVPAWYGYAGEDWRGHVTTGNAAAYGTFLGQRLGGYPNLVWLLGGDNSPGTSAADLGRLPDGLDRSDKTAATDAMAVALRDAEAVPHLMSYHARRGVSSFDAFAGRPWHTVASAYGTQRTWQAAAGSTGRGLPVIVTEAYYDARTSAPLLDDRALRAQAWWSVLHGAGFAYGHENVWDLDSRWREGLRAGSAEDVTRIAEILGTGGAVVASPSVLSSGGGAPHEPTVTGRAGRTAWTYVPTPRGVSVELDALGGSTVTLSWVDPATGARKAAGSHPATGTRSLPWPGWSDAVLVMTAS